MSDPTTTLCSALLSGAPCSAAARESGYSRHQATYWRRKLNEAGLLPERCTCGRLLSHRGSCTERIEGVRHEVPPEALAEAVEIVADRPEGRESLDVRSGVDREAEIDSHHMRVLAAKVIKRAVRDAWPKKKWKLRVPKWRAVQHEAKDWLRETGDSERVGDLGWWLQMLPPGLREDVVDGLRERLQGAA